MRWSLPLVALALGAGACSDDDDAADDADATAAATNAPGTTRTTQPTATTDREQLAGNVVEVVDPAIRFAAPEGWTTVDPAEAGDLTDDAVVAELAERTGVSEEALTNTMNEQVDLFVFSGESDGPIAPNINIIDFAIPDLPSEDQVRTDFDGLGATEVEIEPVDANGNAALAVRYHLELAAAGRTVEGYGLFVDLGEELVNITVTAFDRAEADEVGELVRSTLEPTG